MSTSEKILKAAYVAMTPQQRLKFIVNSMMAEANMESNKEPLVSELEPFAIVNDDIKHLKVKDIINIIVYKDYSSIILAGEPSEAQILEAVENIMFHYHDTVMDEKTEVYVKTVTKIHELQIKMNRVNMNMEALKLMRDSGIIEELKVDGFKFQFTEDTYLKDIERIKTALKRDKIEYEKAKKSLTDMQSKGGKSLTEDDFYNNLAELRKFENYQDEPLMLAEKMTFYGYAQAMKRYNKHIKALNKQANK